MNTKIRKLYAKAYTIPTDKPESDGTLKWDSTTIVIVFIETGGKTGIGYSYSHKAALTLIKDKLSGVVKDHDPMDIELIWNKMLQAVRNLGMQGIAACAISAVDNALYDLKAKLLNIPLVKLTGLYRKSVDVYGSGGFTSYSEEELREQLGGWAAEGIPRVKMKIGREPEKDLARVKASRDAIGNKTDLFVDANGAYDLKQAVAFSHKFAEYGVNWFEEPVASKNHTGLKYIRDHAPPEMEIAAGEYGWDQYYFKKMLDDKAVDILQADVTRAHGITGFKKASNLCETFNIPLSAHCAPLQSVDICCSCQPVRHIEYFHDHVRIENILFDAPVKLTDGKLYPNLTTAGNGITLKEKDANQYLTGE